MSSIWELYKAKSDAGVYERLFSQERIPGEHPYKYRWRKKWQTYGAILDKLKDEMAARGLIVRGEWASYFISSLLRLVKELSKKVPSHNKIWYEYAYAVKMCTSMGNPRDKCEAFVSSLVGEPKWKPTEGGRPRGGPGPGEGEAGALGGSLV
ncbi:MAG: hypothetical protein ACK4SY_10550 [Pyrobaculum sp.]